MSSSTNETLTARPRDVVALAWYRLGYRPRDSLVLIGLHGDRNRAGLAVRTDLPPDARPRDVSLVVAHAAASLRRTGAHAAVLLVVRDDVLERLPRSLVAAACGALRAEGLTVTDVLGVGDTAYRPLTCPPGCCPPTDLDHLRGSAVALAHVLHGDALAPDENALLADVLPDPAAPVPDSHPDGAGERPGGSEAGWLAWAAALAAPPSAAPGPEEAAALARWLGDQVVRDAVLVAVLGAAPDAVSRAVAEGPAGTAELLRPGGAGHLGTLLARRPDEQAQERARAALAAAARAAPPGRRARPLAVLALLAWFQGRGARARLLVDRAEADRPGTSLAALVRRVLDTGTMPPWAVAAQGRAETGGPAPPAG